VGESDDQSGNSSGTSKCEDDAAKSPAGDVVVIHGVTDDGRGYKVLRARDGELEAGAVKPLEQGKPIHGEVVRLKPREQCPLICDVEVDIPKPEPTTTEQERAIRGKGPAQVASEAYRRNWDAIWSSANKRELPN
jgi:hypothetical protein